MLWYTKIMNNIEIPNINIQQNTATSTQDVLQTGIENSLIEIITPIIPLLILLLISIGIGAVLWAVSTVQQIRAHKAVIEMKKILVEMNERDKRRSQPKPTQTPAFDEQST